MGIHRIPDHTEVLRRPSIGMFLSEFDHCSGEVFRGGLTSLETDGSVILVVGDVADSSFAYMSSQLFGDPALDRIPFVGSPDSEPDFEKRLADAGFDLEDGLKYYPLGVTDADCETVCTRLNQLLWFNANPDDVEPGMIRVGLGITTLVDTTDPDTLVETIAAIRDLSKTFNAMVHLIYRESLDDLLETLKGDQLNTALDLIVRLREAGDGNPEQQWVLLEQQCTSEWIDPSL